MRRVSRRFVAPVLALAVGLALGIAGPAAASARARPAARQVAPVEVSVFGDSLAHEAKGALALELAPHVGADPTLQTYPGTALCDFRRAIKSDLARRHPDVLVLEFSGNSGTPCMAEGGGDLLPVGSDRWRRRYLDDLRVVLGVARRTGTRVVWAAAPPLSPERFPSNYPRGLAVAIRRLSRDHGRLRVVDAGTALADAGGGYAATLPCRPDEAAYCRDGRVVVRSDDGLHFDCHGVPGEMGECIGYSAGARRFGEAIAAAAVPLSSSPNPRP
jgi:hypothetical protein